MSDKKPSTADILAKIRGGGAAPKADAAESPAPTPSESEQSAPPPEAAPQAPAASSGNSVLDAIRAGGAQKPAGKPAAAPSGTASILASIKSGGAPKPAAGGEAPKGTSGILASIRGGGAAPAAGAAVPKKAAAKGAAAVDTKAAAGMSAADMIKAARQGIVTADPVTGAAKVAEPKKTALPKKPLVKPAAAKKGESRRSALETLLGVICSPVVIAWSCLTGATAVSSLAMARFMMPNVLVEPPTKFKIGPPTDYGTGTVATKWKAQFGVWIVNDEVDGQQMIYALSTVCTHLGCTPNWLDGEQKFKCPCHGSGFYKTGINFEGPAPRPLERYGVRLAEDGMLEVDKSVKFQRELGQWENAASYVPV